MIIRAEHPDDIDAIRTINREAFKNGPEADVVDQLRTNKAIVLSLIAMDAHKPVGHILFTEAQIGDSVAAALAPMAVLPEYQKRGIGRLLVQDGIERIKSLGYPGVIVLGHPDYYSRFKFRPASEWNIRCEYQGVPGEAFMAIVWDESAFGEEATAHFRPEFQAAL
jgi:putative acetyltransferase